MAERVWLTGRTFFRHYADKHEVLFAGSGELQDLFVRAVAEGLESAAPIDALAVGLDALSELFADRREFARKRQAVILANRELRERELIKLASLSAALADTLGRHGIAEPAASLTAEVGIAAFRVGFERWIAAEEDRGMAELMRESLDGLKAVTSGRCG
ncbi:TetR family transcriptional regulator [Streptomyces violascens]|uniref:acyl-CoA-like ligand-binding transcription factor n=1 Tax=Streptomyces violascens TaxID=67381 RepID=UPI00364C6F47